MLQPKDFEVGDEVKWKTLHGWASTGTVKEITEDHLVVSKFFNASSGLSKADKRYNVKYAKVIENITKGKTAA